MREDKKEFPVSDPVSKMSRRYNHTRRNMGKGKYDITEVGCLSESESITFT